MPCTIVSIKHQNKFYVGSNLDTPNPKIKIWYNPPNLEQYGRVCFGFDYKIAENGMNEHGLFIDCNTVPETTWKPYPDKPDWEEWGGWYETGVPDGILSKCKTVAEALTVFKKYNLLTFRTMKYLVADSEGQSAVLEWTNDGLRITRRPYDRYYQISTNCIVADSKQDEVPCYRYRIAESIFMNHSTAPDVDLIRKVLSHSAMEVGSPTQVSVIYDLNQLQFFVYLYHNFEEVVKLDLMSELEKGYAKYELQSLFMHPSFAYYVNKNKREHARAQ